MPHPLGKHLFTFAVISDSHVNEGEDRSASPYPSNRLANGRFRYAVRSLNRHRPVFAVHLGDMGNPLPGLPTYATAAEAFHVLAGGLRCPLHLLPGNHCVGDKPTGWTPVPRVSTDALEQYARLYGKHYHSFEHGPCHFTTLNSLLLNSGLDAETRQRAWVEDDLARAATAGKRLWLLMHYPPFIATPDELGSYDNVDEPGRSWLLGLFESFEIEAAYTGHVHNYFYNRYAGSAIYTVPALSFVRQDYSELFAVAPDDDEGGRNDAAKLGYLLVDVYESGHRHRLVRTFGGVAAADDPPGDDAPRNGPQTSITGGGPARPPTWLGVELRESWLATVALRTNNSVSPFTRRRARNDWAVLALQEMGLDQVRVPLPELSAADTVERIATLQDAGFRFTVYSHGIPSERAWRLIREHRALFEGWELILDLEGIETAAHRVARICDRLSGDVPCYLNPLRTAVLHAPDGDQSLVDDANVKHEANYGFHLTDRETVRRLAKDDAVLRAFAGFVFRIRRHGEPSPPPWTVIREVSDHGRATGLRHQIHLLFSGNLTSERLTDDLDTANRVAEAAFAGLVAGAVDLFFDTFEDVDRGYFVRHGLVDRRYNPRLAARVLEHLRPGLAGCDMRRVTDPAEHTSAYGRQIAIALFEQLVILLLPSEPHTVHRLELARDRSSSSFRWLDLATGVRSTVTTVADGADVRLAEPRTIDGPVLLIGNPPTDETRPPEGERRTVQSAP